MVMTRKCLTANAGVTLVELMISVLIASVLMLMVYSVFLSGNKVAAANKNTLTCMQSIRSAVMQIDRDLMQSSYLLPQDLKVATGTGELFIAGSAVTAGGDGLSLVTDGSASPPPYYAVATGVACYKLIVDDPNIDRKTGDEAANADFVGGQGIITDNGAYAIKSSYTRGADTLTLITDPNYRVSAGDRVIPAVYYKLNGDGLYRNGEILAENIVSFETSRESGKLTIDIEASTNGVTRDLQYKFPIN